MNTSPLPASSRPLPSPAPSLWIEEAPDGPGVYLIAFYRAGVHTPYGSASPRGRALHYIGYADSIRRRLYEHTRGQGSRLCRAAALAGYELRLVCVWTGRGRDYERALKNRHRAAALCPACAAGNAGPCVALTRANGVGEELADLWTGRQEGRQEAGT